MQPKYGPNFERFLAEGYTGCDITEGVHVPGTSGYMEPGRSQNTSIYDVCNDYSLDPLEKPFNFSEYQLVKRYDGWGLVHKKYREIHYFIGPDGLAGHIY